jgi:hypothetical protein
MPYFIQGVFFQNNEGFDVALDPREGIVTVIRRELFRYVYTGYIQKDAENEGVLVGEMQDFFGHSQLHKIFISDNQISFTKNYNHRMDWIVYMFTKKDCDTWVGQYDGPATGTGISRCIVTEVNDEFLSPEAILKILGLKSAHAWPSEK